MTTTTPEPPAPAPAGDPEGFTWRAFFGFTFMVTPVLIWAVYVIGVVVITIGALLIVLGTPVTVVTNGEVQSTGGGLLGALVSGVLFFLVAQLAWRVYMELLIILFRIYGSLRAIERQGRGM